MKTTALATTLLALLSGACAYDPGFRCSANGGRAWNEYRSAHFILDTDIKEAGAAVLVQQLEELRAAALLALVGEDVETPGHARVIALADATMFEDLAGSRIVAYYSVNAWGEPYLFAQVNSEGAVPETLAHELAHYVSHYLFPIQPTWFAEGLAGFVETLAGKKRTAGSVPPYAEAVMRADCDSCRDQEGISTRKLFEWNGQSDYVGRYHAQSWLLYHWLWNARGPQLSTFENRLSEGDDPADAWNTAFPEFDPRIPGSFAKVDHQLENYLRGGKFAAYAVKAPPVNAGFTRSPLSPAEMHVLLLQSRRAWPANPRMVKELIRTQMQEALREDPLHPIARLEQANPEGPAAIAELRRQVVKEMRPDWRAFVLLGQSEIPLDEKQSAFRRAVELNPESARALNGLAWSLALANRAEEALPLVNRALDLSPWEPIIVETLAEVAARLSRCKEAVRLERRAISMIRWTGARFKARLDEIQARCAKALPAAPH